MIYPDYIHEKAREMRSRKMTLDEIAERLAIPKTTVWYWIKDMPVEISRQCAGSPKRSAAQAKAVASMQAKFTRVRDEAYMLGQVEYDSLANEATFLDFVAIYIGEGYKRSRNTVSVANSDPRVIRLADHWIKRFATHRVSYQCQHHADQDPEQLSRYWAFALGAEPDSITMFRKSNSGELAGRTWRCRHGVVAVNCYETRLRARVQGWMDRMQRGWVWESDIPELRQTSLSPSRKHD